MEGSYRVGYEVNRKEILKLQMAKGSKIGAYECSYDKRSIYVYRVHKEIEGFFITKKQWKELESNFPEFFSQIRRQALNHYINVIRLNLEKAKQKMIEHYDDRKDY